jgi:hypothetical protein
MNQFETINKADSKQNAANSFFGASKNAASFIQPKLTINQPNDVYEQEADAMADKVMRMEQPGVQLKPLPITAVQRKCAHCEEEEKQAQRKEINNGETTANSSLESYVGGLSGSGQSLPGEVRNFYEPRFGYDFSKVKIHTDTVAAKSAQSINALAYTSGNNIVFNAGQYAPGTDSGKRLMGHELTHVVQQGGGDKGILPSYYNEESDAGINPTRNPQMLQRQPVTENCCCCVNSVSISNISRIDNAGQMGHSFDATIVLSKRSIPPDRPLVLLDSCRLEWFERTNVPYFAAGGQRAGQWHDMYAMVPNSPTLAPWANRSEGCESTQTITITDPPALGKRPGRTVNRTLEFSIQVSSSDQCGCSNNTVQATATQVLSMVNGASDWANSSFTTP